MSTSPLLISPEYECATLCGAIGRREIPALRESLQDRTDRPDRLGVVVDVRDVTAIDVLAIAVLGVASDRARAQGRLLLLVDADGPVTRALARLHLLGAFLMAETVPPSVGSSDG